MNSDKILTLINLSKHEKMTAIELRQFVFKVCHDSLSMHYGVNYSDKCFQSSIIIKDVLDKIGINSVIVSGATCLPRVMGNPPYQLSWNGFWDKDHHIWLMTEFYEIVDLTISHLHLHNVNKSYNAHSLPPIWWHHSGLMPSMIKYLHNREVPVLEDDAQNDLEKLRLVAQQTFSNTFDGTFPNFILYGMEAMNELLAQKDHWATGMLTMQQMNIPLPEWIKNRERELLSK